jgi:excisionase family DNA binding protein
MSTERISYKVAQAAEAVGYSRYVLYDAINRQELPAYQPYEGADILILKEDLHAWVTRRTAQTKGRSREF